MRRHLTASAIRVLSRPSRIDLSEPCIIKNAIDHWPAMRERHWHPRRLQKIYGDRIFEWGVGMHSDTTLLISFSRFLSRKHPLTRSRCYLFDSTFDTDCPELLNDYFIPLFLSSAAMMRRRVILHLTRSSRHIAGCSWGTRGQAAGCTRTPLTPAHGTRWSTA